MDRNVVSGYRDVASTSVALSNAKLTWQPWMNMSWVNAATILSGIRISDIETRKHKLNSTHKSYDRGLRRVGRLAYHTLFKGGKEVAASETLNNEFFSCESIPLAALRRSCSVIVTRGRFRLIFFSHKEASSFMLKRLLVGRK